MAPSATMARFLIGVTGAQGVGKSTFSKRLTELMTYDSSAPVRLIPSTLSAEMARLGFTFGSFASSESVLAIYSYHLKRGRECAPGVSVLDRCVVDALAYVRCLKVTSNIETALLEDVSRLLFESLDFVVHLEMSGIFKISDATHENQQLREDVSRSIIQILSERHIPYITVDASDTNALKKVREAIPFYPPIKCEAAR